MFLFGLRSEFLEELWIRKSLASVAAVQFGLLCIGRKSSGLVVYEGGVPKQLSGSFSSMDWLEKCKLFCLVKGEQFSLDLV